MQTEKNTLRFERMSETNIPELTTIMKRAFDDDAQNYLGQPGGPDGYDNGEFLHRWAFDAGGLGWKIIADGRVAGAFIVFINPEGEYVLGNIFVDPAYQNLHIGSRAWNFIEDTYPDAKSWNLDTPIWAIRNHHFYEKLGFARIKVEGDDVVFRKDMKQD
jgi:GNAT superfamily N-acetyltransferase